MSGNGSSTARPTPGGAISRRSAFGWSAGLFLGAAGSAAARPLAGPEPVAADVRDFGALGDGVTDDTEALRAAFAASLCVELPHGTYRICGPLELRPGQVVEGCGSRIVGAGNHQGLRRVGFETDAPPFIEFPVVRDLTLEGFTAALDLTGISYGRFENLIVADCEVGYLLSPGELGTCFCNTFLGCHSRTTATTTVVVAVEFRPTVSRRYPDELATGANSNWFYGCKLGGSTTCVEIPAPVSNVVFVGCSLELADPGVVLLALGTRRLVAGDRVLAVKCSFVGCRFEGGTPEDPGQLLVGAFADDSSFFGCTISGGVEVIDRGRVSNWFPTRVRGAHKIGYSLLPGDASARLGDPESPAGFFADAQVRKLVTYGPSVFESRESFESAAQFSIAGDGALGWADGVRTEPDVALRREVTGRLRVDGDLRARRLGARFFYALTDADTIGAVLQADHGRLELRAESTTVIEADARSGTVRAPTGVFGERWSVDGTSEPDAVVCEGSRATLTVGRRDLSGSVRVRDGAGVDSVRLDGRRGAAQARSFVAVGLPLLTGQPGQVVVVGPSGKLLPCRKAEDPRLAGVLVRRDGAGGGRTADIATAGVAVCCVDAQFGAIAPGDALTTSPSKGFAMKAHDIARVPGALVGKALERWVRGRGEIRILVTIS